MKTLNNYRISPIPEFGSFNYRLKKQTSCLGLYAHVTGRLEACEASFIFENRVMDGEIPREFIPACEQGFRDAIAKGPLAGYPVTGVKAILEGGSYHEVDSREIAFRLAARKAFYQGFLAANPAILEPIMSVVVQTRDRYAKAIIQDFLFHRGSIKQVNKRSIAFTVIYAEVPLSEMLGYADRLRSLSERKSYFSMELINYQAVPESIQQQLIEKTTA